jgi:hypothetical protein
MGTFIPLWNPPEEKCQYKREKVNVFPKNLWSYKSWWKWWNSPRQQNIIWRNDNRIIMECKFFHTDEAEFIINERTVRCIPKPMLLEEFWTGLYACNFVDANNNILVSTDVMKKTKPILTNSIQSTFLFKIIIHENTYLLKENTHCNNWGLLSQNPWIVISNTNGEEMMGAGYYYDSGLFEDLLFVPDFSQENELLLIVLAYYVCRAEIGRNPH